MKLQSWLSYVWDQPSTVLKARSMSKTNEFCWIPPISDFGKIIYEIFWKENTCSTSIETEGVERFVDDTNIFWHKGEENINDILKPPNNL